jgi:hypothetical protein
LLTNPFINTVSNKGRVFPPFPRPVALIGGYLRGNCYVTSEALYHLLGGKTAGWKPMNMHTETDSHWFLLHESGLILDATAHQFDLPLDYSKAKGRGFLTKAPSKRARELMNILLYQ